MNEVQGVLKVYVLGETEFNLKDFMRKLHDSNIVDSKLQITISDGTVHEFNVCEYLEATIQSFIIDGEEVISEEINQKEKVTKLLPLVTKKVI
jgi:hypothetical protein